MRKAAAALLALPLLGMAYLVVLGRGGLARVGVGLGAAVVIALVVLAGLPPTPGNAIPASVPPGPVDARVIGALATGHGLRQPLRVEFGAAMDPSSVAAAMRLSPDAAVTFGWDAMGRTLTITPVAAWRPDTLYVLSVSRSARGRDGGVLASPVRAAVLTARAGTGAIEATRVSGSRTRIDSGFRIVLDRAASLDAVRAALHTQPAIGGIVTAGDVPGEFLFTPSAPLAVASTYEVSLVGLADEQGIPLATTPSITVTTARAPSVVRFRPVAGATRVDRTASISVRFTDRMDRETTARAVRVTAAGKAVRGSVAWAEQGRVLVFVPRAPLPHGARIAVTVSARAVSRAGVPLGKAATGTFTVKSRPKPAPASSAPDETVREPTRKSGGGGAVAGNWAGVESYYLRLMNCTRTGGWVTRDGSCKSPGGRDVAPLTLNKGISSKVARPYARLLATRNTCNHFIGGTPGDRLRRAGYTSYRWGENLGCRSGNAYASVLGSHRFFQAEKPYNGGHYRNLMDARFRQAGIGVWVSGGRVRLVVDFYTP